MTGTCTLRGTNLCSGCSPSLSRVVSQPRFFFPPPPSPFLPRPPVLPRASKLHAMGIYYCTNLSHRFHAADTKTMYASHRQVYGAVTEHRHGLHVAVATGEGQMLCVQSRSFRPASTCSSRARPACMAGFVCFPVRASGTGSCFWSAPCGPPPPPVLRQLSLGLLHLTFG